MERNRKTARREKDKRKGSQETDSVETEGLSETKCQENVKICDESGLKILNKIIWFWNFTHLLTY